jgi:hypothetical protein
MRSNEGTFRNVLVGYGIDDPQEVIPDSKGIAWASLYRSKYCSVHTAFTAPKD